MAKYSKYRVVPKEKLDAISKVIQEKAGVSGGLTLDGMQSEVSNLYSPSTVAGIIDKSIKSLVIPNGTTKIGGYMFDSCKSLESVTVPDSVTLVDQMAFRYCAALKSINMPPNITKITSQCFQGCQALPSINIPNGVTTIEGQAFHSCYALKEIHLPDSITTIVANAFKYCNTLTDIYVPWSEDEVLNAPWEAPVATVHYDAFKNAEGLLFTLNNEGTGYIVTGFETPEDYDTSEGTDLYISEKHNGLSVVGIAPSAFGRGSGCLLVIKDLHLPNTLTSIGDYAFTDQSLSSITLPESITDMSINALAYIYGLTDVYVPWAEGEVANAPWGAEDATIHYNHTT